jgi:Ca2+-binding RTX toxin-like protein
LTGGTGNDRFVFDKPAVASSRDTVVDFVKNDDLILLKGSFFKLQSLVGKALTTATFISGDGAVATATSHRIVYDSSTGKLSYDEDGSGVKAAIEIATFSNKPNLGVNDFLVIA